IGLTNDATLTGDLDPISAAAAASVTILGNGNTIDGGGVFHGFTVDSGSVAVRGVSVGGMLGSGGGGGGGGWGGGGGGAWGVWCGNMWARGGGGALGGGGGAGLGGGLFVGAAAKVTLSDVSFSGDRAQGGQGSSGLSGNGGVLNGTGGGGGSGNFFGN